MIKGLECDEVDKITFVVLEVQVIVTKWHIIVYITR